MKTEVVLDKKVAIAQTVKDSVFEFWKQSFTHGDITELTRITQKGRSTIKRALNFGSCPNYGLERTITRYFEIRQELSDKLKPKNLKLQQNGKK